MMEEKRGIPIDKLGIEQLSELQQQIDKELTFFTESLNELKEVQKKFIDSGDAVSALRRCKSEQSALVPLSESSCENAASYFQRKQAYLFKQMDTIQGILAEKQRTRLVLIEMLQSKVQAAFHAQQSQTSTA